MTSAQHAPPSAAQAPDGDLPRWIEHFNFKAHPLFLDAVDRVRVLKGQKLSPFLREAIAAYIQTLDVPEELKKTTREMVHTFPPRRKPLTGSLPSRMANTASAPASVEG